MPDLGKAVQTVAGWPPALQAAALTAASGVMIALLVSGAVPLFNEWRRRRQDRQLQARQFARQDREDLRRRLRPELRGLLEVGQALLTVAVGLTHDPAREVQFAGDTFRELRPQLNSLHEPELRELRDRFQAQLTEVMKWWAVTKGIQEDLGNQPPINPRRLERQDRYEQEEPGRIQALLEEAQGTLAELEQPVD